MGLVVPRNRLPVVNPIPGFTGLTFDKGIDAGAAPGTDIVAPVDSTLVAFMSNFYKGQPLMLFKADTPLPGAPTQYWYVSEQITPVTNATGTSFRQGDTVATFAQSGTDIEIGWGDPHTSDYRYAPVEAHYGSQKTGWGYNFFKYFGIGGGTPQTSAPSGPTQGITRPGGKSAQDTGGDVDSVFTSWQALRDAPRTAPPSTFATPIGPFKWWYQSFLGKWSIVDTPTAGQTGAGAGAVAQGAVAATSGDYTPATFAAAVLRGLSAPVTPANIDSIVAWEGREGGNWHNTATYNPLNTTYAAPGATDMNSVGVKAYTSWAQGIRATIATLQNGDYSDIVAALRKGRGLSGGSYQGLLTWSGGGYSSV